MKERKKLGRQGFMLIETLIASVFIMSIVVLLYTNLVPLIGDYDRLKNYNTVESTYIAHWARKLVLKGLSEDIFTMVADQGYSDITDSALYGESSTLFEEFKQVNSITKIYLTPYSTSKIKEVKQNFDRELEEYLTYLPSYEKNTSKTPQTGYYRVIVEFCADDTCSYHHYGTIEVKRT